MFSKDPLYEGEEYVKMLENETQCEDPHVVETFDKLTPGEWKAMSPHKPGAKLDSGKPRVGLVLQGFKNALLEVSKVGTCGAAKYCDNGWMVVPDGESRYEDALFRHLLSDEEIDPDFGLLHAAHTAWNALAVLELKLRKKK